MQLANSLWLIICTALSFKMATYIKELNHKSNNAQHIWLIQRNGVALRHLIAWNESTDFKYFGTDGWCGGGCQSFDACTL